MAANPAHNDELIAGFVEEAIDLLQDLPQRVDDYQRNANDAEAINVVFRSVHTIKGNAGFFGLIALKQFSHKLEDVFDEVRQGLIEMDDELYRCLVECLDMLGDMISDVAAGEIATALTDAQSELLERLESQAADARSGSPEAHILAELLKLVEETAAASLPQGADWSGRLKTIAGWISPETAGTDDSQSEATAGSATSTLPKDLAEAKFECHGVDITDHVRPLLSLFLALNAGTYDETVGQAFLDAADEFIAWAESHMQTRLVETVTAARTDFQTVFASPIDIDELLASVVWEQLQPTLSSLAVAETDDASGKTETKQAEGKQPPSEQSAQKTQGKGSKSRILRIKEERVDQFLDDVSTLFITCERLKDLQARMASFWQSNDLIEELRQINAALSEQSTALQRSVVEVRKVSVMGLFSKFPRVARTLASNLGKKLNVHIEGGDTEIDKSLVEDLDGPLMHMIRNVCDHGIEPPDEREQRGAPPDGNLWMNCELTKSHVVITVRDDGRGIDPDKLRNKAVQKKLMREEQAAALSEQDAVELIFHPGFSTAEKISEVSGRGVGLDVVRTRLRDHKGDVHVTSKLGEGTTFRLEIPVRKAVVVVDGLLIRQFGSTFVLPFEHIREIFSVSDADVASVRTKPVVTLRGEPYSAAYLNEILGLQPSNDQSTQCSTGVLVRTNTGTVCLLVESVLGQRKVVVNGMSELLSCTDKLHGVAQLGGGQLALVLNAPELMDTSQAALCV
ncbi:MAG: chemotaxis protein CheA [Pirellulales bacterium]|nr:chemotaxis protein CheA [Pirellulales bacterium]